MGNMVSLYWTVQPQL